MEKEDKIRLQKAIEKSLGEQWEVKPITVPKVNGPRDGLRCRHEGDKHALVIYPDDYAGMLASGESMADIGGYAAGLVEEKAPLPPYPPQNHILHFPGVPCLHPHSPTE